MNNLNHKEVYEASKEKIDKLVTRRTSEFAFVQSNVAKKDTINFQYFARVCGISAALSVLPFQIKCLYASHALLISDPDGEGNVDKFADALMSLKESLQDISNFSLGLEDKRLNRLVSSADNRVRKIMEKRKFGGIYLKRLIKSLEDLSKQGDKFENLYTDVKTELLS